MCGIVGYVGHQDPVPLLLKGLEHLDYRGYDSAGVAVADDSSIQVVRAVGKLSELKRKLASHPLHGHSGIGHTRWATHGAPNEKNAHPHRSGPVVLVHNGIVENYQQHRQRLVESGESFDSDTDTEVVAHLLARQVATGRSLLDALYETLPVLSGSYAIVVMDERNPNQLIAVRNGAPLLVGIGVGEAFLASDVQALLGLTTRVVPLKDGDIAICQPQSIEIHDFDGRVFTREVENITWKPEEAERGAYRHFMLKEIHEQPRALLKTIEADRIHRYESASGKALLTMLVALSRAESVQLTACGSARHAALVGKPYLEKLAGIPTDVDFASELRYRDFPAGPRHPVILVSQSGETADTLAALREARRRGSPTLAICNVPESTIAREADAVLFTDAGPEVGVASTKAFTTQLCMLYQLAIELGRLNGRLTQAFCQELTHELAQLPLLTARALRAEAQITTLAKTMASSGLYLFVARGIAYPIALEGALKLKEIAYTPAEGYPAGELKHGPLALVDSHTSVVVLDPKITEYENGRTTADTATLLQQKLRNNLEEVRARGARLWYIGDADCPAFIPPEHVTALPATSWALAPILLSIPLQFFSYYVALHRGAEIDKPRNLAKSVTVE